MPEVRGPSVFTFASRAGSAAMCVSAARGRGVGQGFRSPRREQTRELPCRSVRTTTDGASPVRRCDQLAQYAQRCVLRPAAARRDRAPRHHRVVRRHGLPASRPAHRDDDTASPSLPRCSSTTSSCRSTARSAVRATAGGPHGTCCPPSAARAVAGAAFLPRSAGGGVRFGRGRRTADQNAKLGEGRSSSPLPGPVARHSPPHGRGEPLGWRRPSTRSCWRRRSQAVFIVSDVLPMEVTVGDDVESAGGARFL